MSILNIVYLWTFGLFFKVKYFHKNVFRQLLNITKLDSIIIYKI